LILAAFGVSLFYRSREPSALGHVILGHVTLGNVSLRRALFGFLGFLRLVVVHVGLLFVAWGASLRLLCFLGHAREPSALAGIPGFPTVFCRSCWSLIRGVPAASLFSRSREPSAAGHMVDFSDSWVPYGLLSFMVGL